MKNYNLNEIIEFSAEKPIYKSFINSEGFRAAIICLKKGLEIKPHPEDYAALLTVIEGKGVFTDSNGEVTLGRNQSIYLKTDEVRGIKAEEDLVILGIQENGK